MKKKKTGVLLLSLTLLLFTVTCVQAQGQGTIRIDPYWPLMTSSPANFKIWVEGSGDPTIDPHLFLVMTESCKNGLSGNVEVHWDGNGVTDIANEKWNGPETDQNKKIPPDTEEGTGYTVASLLDHLGISKTPEPIYWAFVSFPSTITSITHDDPIYFSVHMTSNSPMMLIYAIGKTTSAGDLYDNRIPPTKAGFLVPEPATIAAVATPTLTLLAYALFKRKTIFS